LRRLILVLFTALLSPTAFAGSVDVVRQNFVDYYTAAGATRTSPRMLAALGGQESTARAFAAPGYLLGDGSWSDLNYKETPAGGWSPWEHSRRLFVMAKAYRTPGTALYNDASLRTAIESALRYVPSYYGVTTWPSGNWWFWTIGVPLDLAPTLVLMQGSVDQQVFDECVRTLAFHIGSNPSAKGLVGPTPVGENLTWSAYTHLCLAIVRNDATMLAAARDAMATVCTTVPQGLDGIQADASFHQHGAQLYTGGYGGSFANDVARYALLTRTTDLTLPPQALATFSTYIADGVGWTLYGNYFDVSVTGREAVRNTTTGYNGVAALVQASQFASPRVAEIRAAAAQMLESWQWTLPPELAGLATIVEQTKTPAAWPSGHRHYFDSDYTVHRRDGWFASVKMFSNRTKSGEKTNNENLRGSRQSDGRFSLSLDGDEFFGGDVPAALDWSRLPGITVEQKADAANDTFGYGTRSVAGGTGDGRNGVSAMDLAALTSTLTAKKSWFFFDDAIVFLTSGVTSSSANRVETIVNQWPLENPNATITTDNRSWLFADRVGYWFPNGMPNVSRESRSGTWASLGASTDTTPRSATFLTMWYDHGLLPFNANAAYAIVPNTTAEAMRTWAASNPIRIVANDTNAAALRRGNTFGAVFWSAGSVDGYESDLPSIVYVVTEGTTLHVYASDPTNGSGTFRITIPGAYVSRDVVTTSYRSTTIAVPRNGGRTFHATLTPARMKSRVASHR
jgi:chondroitin AC lyase